VHHLTATHVDAHVRDGVRRLATYLEEHQVAGMQVFGRDPVCGQVLLLCRPRQVDAGPAVRPLDQAGAVEAGPGVGAAPDVRRADEGARDRDDGRVGATR
jgi:hypothetical protein